MPRNLRLRKKLTKLGKQTRISIKIRRGQRGKECLDFDFSKQTSTRKEGKEPKKEEHAPAHVDEPKTEEHAPAHVDEPK